jgi:hypothetical protein
LKFCTSGTRRRTGSRVARLQTAEATTASGAPSFAHFAKGGYDDGIHNGRCRTDKSCAGSIAAHPCKKRKDGAPSVNLRTHESLKVGHPPEESRLPMLLTVCIEAGRKTLTHTSWTGLAPVSRKWMSGQAAALAALNDRWPFPNLTAAHLLRDSSPSSARRPPSPLDFYLSWMSRFSLGFTEIRTAH